MDMQAVLSQLVVPAIVGFGGIIVTQIRSLVKKVEDINISVKRVEMIIDLEIPAVKERLREQDAKITFLNTKILRR